MRERKIEKKEEINTKRMKERKMERNKKREREEERQKSRVKPQQNIKERERARALNSPGVTWRCVNNNNNIYRHS